MPLVATALRATQYSVWLKRRMSLNEVLSVCVSGDQGGCSQIPKSSQGIDSFEKAVRSVRSDVIVYKKKGNKEGWRREMWRLAVQYRSPGYPGNLASLQCQLGCLLPQGKHLLTHTYTPTYRVASCFTYRRALLGLHVPA
jgi:hypothetical protein